MLRAKAIDMSDSSSESSTRDADRVDRVDDSSRGDAEVSSTTTTTTIKPRIDLKGLNNELAQCASYKDKTKARELFEVAMDHGCANNHTFAGLLNCYVRCGELKDAEKLLQQMKKFGKNHVKPDVIHYTTLMKGYCEQGFIDNALLLFQDMVIRRIEPNVRTVNTFLRGCVQTGSIAQADKMLTVMQKDYKVEPDVSSWEYLVILLSQGLKMEKILPIIGRLKGNLSMNTGLSSMHIHIARAAVLLGELKICRRSIQAAKDALKVDETMINQEQQDSTTKDEKEEDGKSIAVAVAAGGKRAWKTGSGGEDDTRAQSLVLFRQHKIGELQAELATIESFLEKRTSKSADYLLPFFFRVLSFHATSASASTTKDEDAEEKNASAASSKLVDSVCTRFGMDTYLSRLDVESSSNSSSSGNATSGVAANEKTTENNDKKKEQPGQGKGKGKKASSKAKNQSVIEIAKVANEKQEAVMKKFQVRDKFASFLNDGNTINFHEIFGNEHDLKLEICSGAGEWAVAQATADTSSNYVTLELRHDRVYQTFYRNVCSENVNLCTIGGDAQVIMKEHLSAESIQNIYVNHPEPPQQTGGEKSEGKHLLTLDFFAEIGRILKPQGMMTIVTDNIWYANFLVRLLGTAPHPRVLSNVEIRPTENGLKAMNTKDAAGTAQSPYTVYVGKFKFRDVRVCVCVCVCMCG